MMEFQAEDYDRWPEWAKSMLERVNYLLSEKPIAIGTDSSCIVSIKELDKGFMVQCRVNDLVRKVHGIGEEERHIDAVLFVFQEEKQLIGLSVIAKYMFGGYSSFAFHNGNWEEILPPRNRARFSIN